MTYSLALTWTLNETADHFLKVGKDLVYASTLDDVQPLALLASERFGATLAICPLTRTKIEVLIKSQADHVVIGFAKAQVGFNNGGATIHLSRSLAGVNFLALAATLVSITNTFAAGTALERMIIASAVDRTLVPTAYQLRDLLNVLEPRLVRAGFLNDVLGWKDWWIKSEGISEESRLKLIEDGEPFPDADGLEKIVASLREISRIGEAKSVTFTAGLAAPWLTAFIKWCLGEPPIIYGPNSQELLSQSGTGVTIIYSNEEEFHRLIRIEVITMFSSFAKIIFANLENPTKTGLNRTVGMVDIQTRARHVLRMSGFESELSKRALLQALPLALKQIRDNSSSPPRLIESSQMNTLLHTVRSHPFPPESVIAGVAARYLSLDEPLNLRALAEGIRVTDQPLICLWAEKNKPNPATPFSGIDLFIRGLSIIVADILTLSLFNDGLDSMVVYYDPRVLLELDGGYAGIIQSDLLGRGKTTDEYSTANILNWALLLIGCDGIGSIRHKTWAGTSIHGQVVFPKLFENLSPVEVGYLELYCIPGILTTGGHSTKVFSSIKCSESRFESSRHEKKDFTTWPTPVTQSMNLYPDENVLWKVQLSEHYISVGMGWSRGVGIANPYSLLNGLSRAIFVGACPHGFDASASDCTIRYHHSQLQGPLDNPLEVPSLRFGRPEEQPIKVFPVSGNKGLRALALATIATKFAIYDHGSISTIIGNGACLDCLMDHCRLLGCEYIVL